MTAFAFALIVLAGLIHASWNIAAKKASGDARFAFQSGVFLLLVWAPVGVGFGWNAIQDWGRTEWGLVAASGVVHVFYFVTLLRGYRHADLTVVYPLARGSGPLLSSVMAVVLLGERLSPIGIAGIGAVVSGVFLIAGGPRLWQGAHEPAKRERLYTGLRYGLLTGAFIAAYTVIDGYAVKVALMSPILVDYGGSIVRTLLLAPAALLDRRTTVHLWKAQWKYAMVVAVFSPISYVLVLFAMQQAPLSHVAPAREVSMLFAALLGGQLLQEGDRMLRFVGALCIAGGVVALAVA